MQTQTRMIFTCVPPGSGAATPRLTVFVSPRLEVVGTALPGATLASWELGQRWWSQRLRDTAAAGGITVSIDGRAAVRVSLSAPGALDDSLWPALLDGSTAVQPRGFSADVAPDGVRTFPAAELSDYIHKSYLNTAWKSPSGPPALVDGAGNPTDFGQFVGDTMKAGALLHGGGRLTFGREDAFAWTSVPVGVHHLYMSNRFYVRHEGPPVPLGPGPAPVAHDFHAKVAMLGDHPAVLRALGLVFDVDLPPGSLATDGTITVQVAWRDVGNPLDVSPTTHYMVKNGAFLPAPALPFDLVDGYLRFDTAADGTQIYKFAHVDVDGAAHQAVAFGMAVAGQVGDPTRPPIDTSTLPSLRTGGITIFRPGRDGWLSAMLQRGADVNAAMGQAHLFAEDLLRGFRVDVEMDGDGHWRSLCARQGTIELLTANPPHAPITVGPHEGYVRAASGATADAPPDGFDQLYLHEAIAGWDGWSLVARRPGGAVAFDGQTETVVDGGSDGPGGGTISVTPDARLIATYAPVPGTLPRLRFGHTYRLRGRAVDLAGGGLGNGDGNTAHASPPIVFGRYEPVPAPALVLRAPVTEAETVERMVVRTSDADSLVGPPVLAAKAPGAAATAGGAAHAGATATALAKASSSTAPIASPPIIIQPPPPPTSPSTNERHVVAPKATLAMAEQHGMLDAGFAAGADPRWYAVWCKEQGTLQDTAIVDPSQPLTAAGAPATRNPADLGDPIVLCNPASVLGPPPTFPAQKGAPLPGGQYVIHTGDEVPMPYLPDPMAGGLTLVDPEPAADSVGPTEIFTPYLANSLAWAGGALASWPEKRSHKLVLRKGTGAQIVREAAGGDARTIIFDLPPGRRLKLRYSSTPAADKVGHLSLWNQLAAQLPPADRDQIESLVRAGEHWMFTPWREVEMVHATQRPVTGPVLDQVVLRRSPGDTTVTFTRDDFHESAVLTHSWSTSHVDVKAAWGDWIDDGRDPGGVRLEPHSASAFRVAITEGVDRTPIRSFVQAVQRAPSGPLGIVQPVGTQPAAVTTPCVHHVGDTKHHTITYTPVGTTRFQEFFPAALIADHTNLERVGDPYVADVPSTAPPPAPAVRYAVPTFKWEPIAGGRRRHGGGVRVYLDRPWFASGEGERLAVVLAPAGVAAGDPVLDQVTRWGTDPVWTSASPPALASAFRVPAESLTYFAGTDHAVALPRVITGTATLPTGATRVPVVGYLPEWNADRGLWFVDVELDTGTSYWPFISLALVRWQPGALDGVPTSQVVRCQFAQLAPDVTASAARVGSQINVAVTSVSAGNAYEALGDTPGLHQNPSWGTWEHAHSLSAAHRVRARVETLDPSLSPSDPANQLRWRAVGTPVELLSVGSNPYPVVQWAGSLPAPTTTGTYRVVVTLSELYASETGTMNEFDGVPGRERVVFIDGLAI